MIRLLTKVILWGILATVGVFLLAACCGRDPDRPPAVEENGQRYLLCGQIADDREEETFSVGELQFKRRGFVVERVGPEDGSTKLGIIAGIEEWNAPNQANVQAISRWFVKQGAEAIILVGGVGPNRESCLNALETLAASELPVLSLIGATADFAGYRRAVAQARKNHPNVIDLSVARSLRWDGLDIISLPGYANPFYLGHRRGGCAYRDEDVDALGELIDDAEQPVLLVAGGPPRGQGRKAVDRARGGINIGDERMSKVIESSAVQFGVFGHVYEAGGNATADVGGQNAVEPGQWSKTLYLNPGAIEAVPYDRVNGRRSRGMGALLEIGPQGAKYRLHLLEALELTPATNADAGVDGDVDGGADGGAADD